jgi:glutathione S-transferase
MFAPVVHRFRSFAIAAAPEAQAYMDTMMALPAFQQWTSAALVETLIIDRFETA